MTTVQAKRAAFRALHSDGCFVMPNPGTSAARATCSSLGFKALATTSAGFAWSLGRPDNGDLARRGARAPARRGRRDRPARERRLRGRLRGRRPRASPRTCAWRVATGVAGLSIEDSTGDADDPLFDVDDAVDRDPRRARGDRRSRRRHAAHRPRGGLHRRPARPRRDDPPAAGLRGRRRRLPLRAGHPHPRADHGGGRRGRAQARQRADRLRRATSTRAPTSRRWASAASASAARSRARPGAASCAPRSGSPSKGRSTASPTRRRARELNKFFRGLTRGGAGSS